MTKPVVGIVGLGQIGGSLAAALTRKRLARVVGVTRRTVTVQRAKRMKIVHHAGTNLAALADADVVFLATPVRTLLKQIPDVLSHMKPGALLTDTGSTKAPFDAEVRRLKPKNSVIGGHPMAGNERAGLDGLDVDLFANHPWALVPTHRATPAARRKLVRLIKGVGARPVWMKDPKTHDTAVARLSHVPHLLACTLLNEVGAELELAGNSFRDATRVALSDPSMVVDFLLTNRGPVRKAAAKFEQTFRALARAISSGDEKTLRRFLAKAGRRRARLR